MRAPSPRLHDPRSPRRAPALLRVPGGVKTALEVPAAFQAGFRHPLARHPHPRTHVRLTVCRRLARTPLAQENLRYWKKKTKVPLAQLVGATPAADTGESGQSLTPRCDAGAGQGHRACGRRRQPQALLHRPCKAPAHSCRRCPVGSALPPPMAARAAGWYAVPSPLTLALKPEPFLPAGKESAYLTSEAGGLPAVVGSRAPGGAVSQTTFGPRRSAPRL